MFELLQCDITTLYHLWGVFFFFFLTISSKKTKLHYEGKTKNAKKKKKKKRKEKKKEKQLGKKDERKISFILIKEQDSNIKP